MVEFTSSVALAAPAAPGAGLVIGGRNVPLVFHRNLRARKYILRVRSDGSARVTIPRGGNEAYAQEFAWKNRQWVETQLEKQAKIHPTHWGIGTTVLFRGVSTQIEEFNASSGRAEQDRIWKIRNATSGGGEPRKIRFANHVLQLPPSVRNLKVYIESLLKRIAAEEIPERTSSLARQFSIPIARVVIRNQRSRWGSCSIKKNISLNWRLIQTPAFVRDYMIIHELCHIRHMDHSPDYWCEVQRLCPAYPDAERWLKDNQRQLFHG